MPPKNKKNRKGQNNDAGQVKEEDTTTTTDDQTKPEDQPVQVPETKPEEQKAPETTNNSKPSDLSDSVVLVNSSIKSDSVPSPKKEEIPVTTHQEVKVENTEHASQPTTKVQDSPKKVESHPVQEKAPEEHKAEPQPEVKHEEPKHVESKPQEIVVPEVKKEEPKHEEKRPETPKKEEPKAPEVKHEEKKPEPEVKTEKVEAPVENKSQPVPTQDSGKKVGAAQSPEKTIVVDSPSKDPPKTQSPLNLDGSIGKNYEVVTKSVEEDDTRSDVAEVSTESRLLDDLSVPNSISQRSSLDTQPFTISREPSVQTFHDKSAQAERLAAEAAELRAKKDYAEAVNRLKNAVDVLDPASLDKSETESATKKVFEYTLRISEIHFESGDLDQALNFSQIVQHADPSNLLAAWITSQVYVQKGKENEALETLKKASAKYGKRTDQAEYQKKVSDEQARLDAKLNPKEEKKVPEPTPVQKTEKKVENEQKAPENEGSSNENVGYTVAVTLVGGLIGLGASYALKLQPTQKTLLTAFAAVGSGLFAFLNGGDDKKKGK